MGRFVACPRESRAVLGPVRVVASASPLAPVPLHQRRCSTMRSFLVLMLFTLLGCARLPTGELAALSRPPQIKVILIRGFLDWYSAGVDQLANQLHDQGVPCQVYREDQWREVGKQLRNYPRQPLVMIGFSYGADDAILIARQLNDVHQNVDLLITIDPVTPADIPPNTRRCCDFYQSNGIWDVFPWLRGMPVKGAGAVENINLRNRPDLLEADTSHATIAGNAKVRAGIIALVRGVGN
jgi:pimeloyl-ACP methyl ester carboxylesterase